MALNVNIIPETQETDSDTGDSDDHNEYYIDNSEEDSDSENFLSDSSEEHNEQESNAGNPMIISDSDSHLPSDSEYDLHCDSDSSDNSLRPFKRRIY